jgi:hypothetical protein
MARSQYGGRLVNAAASKPSLSFLAEFMADEMLKTISSSKTLDTSRGELCKSLDHLEEKPKTGTERRGLPSRAVRFRDCPGY